MSLLKASLESPPSIALPFRVRMDPYLVESICELARLVRDKGASTHDISGLLFGKVETGIRIAQALKTFVDMGPHSELARRQRWEKAYQSTAEEAKKDPELSTLDIVGWFSFRAASGLLSSDVVFHNQHFRKSEDIALVIWREGPSQITVEVYSKSDSDTITADDYRWGSVRLSADIRHMREPVELALRAKLADDSYLRAYLNDEPVSHFEALKRRAEETSRRLFGFLHKEKVEAPMEDVKGLIGDGRLPGRSRPAMDAIEPLASPQAYFNPYSDHIVGRGRTNAGGQKPAGPPPASWPSSGAAYGTAPARAPEYRSDFNFRDDRSASGHPPQGLAPQQQEASQMDLELMQIGRAPLSGRPPANEVSGLPMLLRPPTPPSRPSVWPWAIGICLLCSALVFGFLALGGLQGENGKLGQMVEAVFPGNALNLRVRNEDDRLRLSWNQRNPIVSSATNATLQIFDGQMSRDIHLDGRQVADGSVLYRPQTNDITFRLEVHGDQGSTSGSVRLLDGLSSRQSTLDVSLPPPNTAPTQPPFSAEPSTNNNPASAAPSAVPPAAASPTAGLPPASGPPSTDPVTPSVRTTPRTSARNRAPRYETPETIKPIQSYVPPSDSSVGLATPPASGTTINGWDAVPASKGKTRNFVAAHPVNQITPNVANLPVGVMRAKTRVAIQVGIDAQGRVTSARPLTAGVNGSVLISATSAARQWTFNPATSNGRAVSSYHTIVFEFPAH